VLTRSKFFVYGKPRGLLLLAMEVKKRDTRLQLAESLKNEADLLAAAKEYECLVRQVRLDEAPQQGEFLVESTDGVVLRE
jgi:hypothetical protein